MKKEELFAQMQEIVDEYVEAYKSDLDIDKKAITEWDEKWKKWWAVWVVRDHGTQLQRFTNAIDPMGYIDAVFNSMSVEKLYIIEKKNGEYFIDDTFFEFDEKKKRWLYPEITSLYLPMKKYIIEVYATDHYTYLMNRLEGVYESEDEARCAADWLMEQRGGKSVYIERKERW